MPFTPRLNSTGMNGNPWWYSNSNIFYAAGYGLPNCTCYAYGRYAEARNDWAPLPSGNGGDWYDAATNFQRGPVPQLGAVICYTSPSQQWDGHVAIVEVINADGTIVTSNSAYGGSYFWTATVDPNDGYLEAWMKPPTRDYVCQGFIYNDVEPIPGVWGPWTLVNYLKRQRKRRCGLA